MNAIEQYLRSISMSRKRFCELIKISPCNLWRIEHGQIPSKETVLKIYEVTKGHITPNMLYGIKKND